MQAFSMWSGSLLCPTLVRHKAIWSRLIPIAANHAISTISQPYSFEICSGNGGSSSCTPKGDRSITSSAAPAASTASIPSTPVVREKMEYDVVIVGGGPAGLSAAVRLKQLSKEKGRDLSVCLLDKGSEVGAHILSGNVLETRALDELLPGWQDDPDCPIKVKATHDRFYVLPTGTTSIRLPAPPQMHNKGNYIVSLSQVCRWLSKKAEDLGVEVYAGFAGRNVLYDWDGNVTGVATADAGIGKDGRKKDSYTPGVDLMARLTLFGEGCRGSLSQELIKRFQLSQKAGADLQTYALGLKEVWEVPESVHKQGTVVHTVGYPLDHATYGGGFIYHMADRKVALGVVIALDYKNPHLNTFQEFQKWKTHPAVRKHIEGGTCLQYGARTLNEGGLQSIPKLTFPGGALIGCSAGFLNVPKIKGTHTAMFSGMLAAEATMRTLEAETEAAAKAAAVRAAEAEESGEEPEPVSADNHSASRAPLSIPNYEVAFKNSWMHEELTKARNIRPGFRHGLYPGLAYAALDTYLLRGKAPWTLQHRHADHETLRPADVAKPISYPARADGVVTFDLPTSLYRSGTNHDHDQPPHLQMKDPAVPERVNKPQFDGPETRYCPAGVYSYSTNEFGRIKLEIAAQNCLHCKACDIKDPTQNIKWTVPEGGGGPSYTVM